MAMILSASQKWAQLDKEYLRCDWTSETNIRMAGGMGGDISARKVSFFDQVINC